MNDSSGRPNGLANSAQRHTYPPRLGMCSLHLDLWNGIAHARIVTGILCARMGAPGRARAHPYHIHAISTPYTIKTPGTLLAQLVGKRRKRHPGHLIAATSNLILPESGTCGAGDPTAVLDPWDPPAPGNDLRF